MAKRIKIYFPDGENQVEIYEDQLAKFLAKCFKKDKKEDRPLPKNDLEEEAKSMGFRIQAKIFEAKGICKECI